MKQVEDNVAARDNLDFTADELAEIDKYAVADAGIDLRATSSNALDLDATDELQ